MHTYIVQEKKEILELSTIPGIISSGMLATDPGVWRAESAGGPVNC
jgi:hypothetical protein